MKVAIVGRFQTPYLHEGHKALIDHAVLCGDEEVIILVGRTGMNPTQKDPLSVETRITMIRDYVSEMGYTMTHCVLIHPFKDIPFSDKKWVEELDGFVGEDVVMIGSRDSFIEAYKANGGANLTMIMPAVGEHNATKLRDDVSVKSTHCRTFREGIIHAHNSKPYPNIYPTVDQWWLLLGRKHGEEVWRMPGGFLDVTDASMEAAVTREIHEECGNIALGIPEYVTSCPVDDRRYKGVPDTVFTTVFSVEYVTGTPKAGDDLEEVMWFTNKEILDGKVPLLKGHEQIILDYLDKKR